MNKIIIILVIFVMLFSGFTLLENSQTNNFYENNINTNNFISSNSPIYNLTIYIHNSPAGNGYYQQLFNFNSTSYFINNLNQNASNFYISYENGTLIYSWIQNWNFTTKNLTVWSKLQNGTKVIMIEIFNQNTNLLSANGYVGLAPQLSTTYGEYNNFNEVAFNGQITVNNTTFLTNSFSNALGVNTLYTSNLSQMALKYHNDTITSQNFTTQTIDGLGLTSNTSKNYSSILWNYDFPTTGTFWVNYTEYSRYLDTDTWGLYLTKNSHIGNINDLGFANLGGSPFNTSGVYSYGVHTSYYTGSMEINYGNDTIIQNTHRIYTGSGEWDNQTITTSFNPIYWQFNGLLGYASDGSQSFTAYFSNLTYAYEGTSQHIIASQNNAFFPDNPNMLPNNKMPTFSIELNIYNINIKSFDKQSNPIHNYFFYNNSVYSANNNTFIFKNKTSFFEISLIPLNFSTYFTNFKNITISQSQFINNNNSYYYNLSIYYYNSNLNTVNPYDFANYIYPISILVFLLLGGIILFGTIKYRRSN